MLRRPLLTAAAVVLFTAFGAAGSNAASPGRNGRIAYVHSGRIYSMTSHGGKRHRLTRLTYTRHLDEFDREAPSWQPLP
jgi:hypothetical protein